MGLVDKIGGGFKVNSVQDQSKWAMDTMARDYPQLMQMLNSQLTPNATAELEAAKAVTPGYNDLAVGELNRLAPEISKAQGAMDAGQAAADVANLEKYGVPAAAAMRGADAAANPEWYKNMEGLSDKLSEAFKAASPNLSAGSRAEIERGVGRMGGADASAATTAAKAMNFGSAHQAQVQNFTNILSNLAGVLPQLKTGLSPASLALGRDSRSSPVAGAVTPVTKPGATAYNAGQGMFGGLLGLSSDNEKNRAGKFKTWGDTLEQDSRSFSNISSGVGGMMGG